VRGREREQLDLEARREEFRLKLERIRQWLSQERLDGVLLTRRDSFAWATAGGDNRVSSATEMGAADLWVDHDSVVLLANNIEAARIDEEELDGLDVDVFAWPWYRDAEAEIQRFVAGRHGAADAPKAGLGARPQALFELRYQLTPQEIERYLELGRLAADAVETVAARLSRKESERQIAAKLNAALLERGLEPVVTLVAADGRIHRYRHPVPTDNVVERSVMLVSCARKGGLIASLTRLVHFGRLSKDLEERHAAVVQIDAAIMQRTRPGKSGADLFDELTRLYAEAGFPGEWELHHQGGATGYASREWRASPNETRKVQLHQAFAWNPSITGTKSEDTIVVTEEGFTLLTHGSGKWPALSVEVDGTVIQRPDILRL